MDFEKLIDKLIEKNLLTTDGDKIKIKPHDQYNFTTYPIQDDYILVSYDEYIGLLTRVYMFNEELTDVVDYEEPREDEIIEESIKDSQSDYQIVDSL